MPFTTHGGARLYWKLEGAIDRPPLVLLNSIGTDMGLWDRTLPYLPLAHVGLRGDRRRRYLFQSMITRIARHEICGRLGLDDRTRRLLVLAITASLGRWEAFALHVRAGLSQGGLTRDELKETLMQTAIYAGAPAANTGFAEAQKIMAEIDEEAR